MTNTLKLGWHVLYVRSCQEKKVHRLLQEGQLESFLPMFKTIRQWSDRKKIIFKPLFPSYVFVNISSSLEFYEALTVNGVSGYVRFGDNYATIEESEIDKIKLVTTSEEIFDSKVSNESIKVGEIKKISSGPLEGLECEILTVDDSKKLIVRIDSLRQNITATISNDYLSKLETVQ